MTPLRTERLTLRAAQDSDLAPLFRLYNNETAMRYWGSPLHRNTDDTANFIEGLKEPGDPPYLVWDLDGTAIGCGGIRKGYELGFLLHPDHWGKGLAREACGAIIEHVWKTTDLPQIIADADPRNRASVTLLSRLGFVVTGFAARNFHFDGEWSDSVYFRIGRPE